MRNLRALRHSARQRIESDLVLTRLGELMYRDINLALTSLHKNDSNARGLILEGLMVIPGTGMSVDVTFPAIALQDVNPPNRDFSYVVENNDGDALKNFVITGGDATHPRKDMIEAQIQRVAALLDDAVDVIEPIGETIITSALERDYEYQLVFNKKEGTPAASPTCPAATAATAGTLLGTVDFTTPKDLSVDYLINISIGYDQEFVAVDCRGATPSATTGAEVVAALNGAGFGTIAYLSSNFILITAPGTGEVSNILIKQPVSYANDGVTAILGITTSPGYVLRYQGTNAWFKIVEINVPQLAADISATNILDRTEKASWTADASTIVNEVSFQAHRESDPMDHVDESVKINHLEPAILNLIGGKITLFRDGYAAIYAGPTNAQQGRFFATDILLSQVDGTALTLGDVEQQYPKSRLDKSQETIGGAGYSVLTSLSESAGDKISFVAGSLYGQDRHQRVGLYIRSVGNGYTHLRIDLHDNLNNPLATVQTAFASLATGWNYFDLPYVLTATDTYHYHVYVVGFGAGTTPVLENDGGGAQSFRELYRPLGGLLDGTATLNAVRMINHNKTNYHTINGASDDNITTAGTGYSSLNALDVMAADLNDGVWASSVYQNYILIDPVLGRLKFPAGVDAETFFANYNVMESFYNADAKNLLRHQRNQSIEDDLAVKDRIGSMGKVMALGLHRI